METAFARPYLSTVGPPALRFIVAPKIPVVPDPELGTESSNELDPDATGDEVLMNPAEDEKSLTDADANRESIVSELPKNSNRVGSESTPPGVSPVEPNADGLSQERGTPVPQLSDISGAELPRRAGIDQEIQELFAPAEIRNEFPREFLPDHRGFIPPNTFIPLPSSATYRVVPK